MLTDVSEERAVSVSTLKMEVAGSFEIPVNTYQATMSYFVYLLPEFFNNADNSCDYTALNGRMISEWLLKKTSKEAVPA
jgi:hypothetical protein